MSKIQWCYQRDGYPFQVVMFIHCDKGHCYFEVRSSLLYTNIHFL